MMFGDFWTLEFWNANTIPYGEVGIEVVDLNKNLRRLGRGNSKTYLLKGTVSRDFRPPIYFAQKALLYLGPAV